MMTKMIRTLALGTALALPLVAVAEETPAGMQNTAPAGDKAAGKAKHAKVKAKDAGDKAKDAGDKAVGKAKHAKAPKADAPATP